MQFDIYSKNIIFYNNNYHLKGGPKFPRKSTLVYLALEMSYSVHFKHCESRKDRRNRGHLGELRYLSTETRLGGGERGIRTLGTL